MANSLFIFLTSFFLIWLAAKEVKSCRQEDYWKMKLPNVPIPKLISNNLFHSTSDDKVKANLNQPYTALSWKYKEDNKEKEIVAQPNEENGNMKPNVAQPYTALSWKYKEDNKEKTIVTQPDEENGKMKAAVAQPYTALSWKYKEDSKEKEIFAQPTEENGKMKATITQPYTALSWKYKDDNKEEQIIAQPNEENGKMKATIAQPYTALSWKYKEDNKDKEIVSQSNEENNKMKSNVAQPYTALSWKYKEDNKDKTVVAQSNEENGKMKVNVAQPYTALSWKYKEDNTKKVIVSQSNEKNDNKKTNVAQPYTALSWKYKEDSKDEVGKPNVENGKMKVNVAQPYTALSWKYKEDNTKKVIIAQPNEENDNKKANVAQPYTALSWKYKEDNKKKDVKDKSVHNHQSHSHFMHHLNAIEDKAMVGGSVFFIEENLKLGKKLRHDFQKNPKANFLPRDIASSMPFAVDKYSEILNRLSINPNSAEATSIKEALSLCLERPHVKKENRTCVQSMEDLVDFVIGELGTNNVKVATMSTSEDKVPIGMQDYWITKLNKLEIPNGDGVACHKMVYPYAVYWCHHQQDIGQYAVTLVNSDGITVDTTAVCHYDTYAWEPEVPALLYIGIRPGDAPVCHFAAINDMFWSLNGKTTTINSGVAQ